MSETYTVRAKRWEHGWELHIDSIGVTQSRTLSSARRQVIDYIETVKDSDLPADVRIDIVDDELSKTDNREIAQVRRLIGELDVRQRETAERSRTLAKRLKATGLSGAEVAVVMGVSEQRVSQLVR